MVLLLQYTLIFASRADMVALSMLHFMGLGVLNLGCRGIMIMGALGARGAGDALHFAQCAAIVMILGVLAISALVGVIYSCLLAVACINFKADQTSAPRCLLRHRERRSSSRPSTPLRIPMTFHSIVRYAVRRRRSPSISARSVQLVHARDRAAARRVLRPAFYKTRFGLRLMACGEHPQAADSVGINVYKMRWAGVLISGFLGGISGIVFITAGVSEWRFEYGVASFGFCPSRS